MAAIAGQAGLATNQQAQDVAQTAISVEQMARTIEGVAKGAQEQATAVRTVSKLTDQINAAMGEDSGSGAWRQGRAVSERAETLQLLPQKFKLDTRPDLPIIKPTLSMKSRDGEK